MSVIDDFRKVIQDFIAPELRTINAKLDALKEITEIRFKNIEEKMDFHFNAIMKELATDKRIERLEQLVAKQNENKDATQ